jgi:hypothetical protein
MDDNRIHKPVFKYKEIWDIQGKGGLINEAKLSTPWSIEAELAKLRNVNMHENCSESGAEAMEFPCTFLYIKLASKNVLVPGRKTECCSGCQYLWWQPPHYTSWTLRAVVMKQCVQVL